MTDGRALMDGMCRFWFAVRDVPTGQDRYRVRVADRDGRVYGEAELEGTLVTFHLR
ncbi:hypothetical protein OOK41_23720 [Micromonospora sp. NBC_01655]|uniref:hypothetical protein n=1 Tax=Micromonospora sp. NBC_01655 TaxID=2975983 RepID=UPI00224FA84A|nr:hypothetical protein [Micromonospora sp. NBC_01655]MCX4473276.1 hypothetical protein [Micromonospora sp. NBC_01655]